MNVVSDRFHTLASGTVRPLDFELGISWTKTRNDDVAWFTLGTSQLDGVDLLGTNEEDPIQPWDAYDYQLMKDRVVEMNVERSVEFPYNIQSAIADVKLNNYDGYFSYDNASSTLAQYILPSRPLRMYLGFVSGGLTPVFVGLTENIPTYSGVKNETATLTAIDFLASIGDMSLKNMVIMEDARTDEVIAEILDQFGLESYMYDLEPGINTIPFVYFESGKNAGNALKELIQAENGSMWIDEKGIIRFEPRTGILWKTPVLSLTNDDIVSIKPSRADDIINTISIEADVRKVADFQPIFTNDNENGYDQEAAEDNFRIPANGSKEVWLTLDDPCVSASALVFNGDADDSNFTALKTSDGSAVTSNVTATNGTLLADAYKVTISNLNNFPISINYIQLWGEPAKIVGESPSIKYYAYDEDSVEAFGIKKLEITDNKCFGSYQNVDAYANDILSKYKDYNSTAELEIRGDPSLQMQDLIEIEEGDFEGTWIVLGISHKLADSKLTTKIKVRRQEVLTPFTLDESTLNGTDVLG